MISSGGHFARAFAIRTTQEAATGRPKSAALIVAALDLASLVWSEADHPRHAISNRGHPASTIMLTGRLPAQVRFAHMPPD